MIVAFYETHTDEELAVGPQGKPQTVNATGPGIWSDAVQQWLLDDAHVRFVPHNSTYVEHLSNETRSV